MTYPQPRVAERHFLDLRKKYGNALSVDLVNKVQPLDNYSIFRLVELTILVMKMLRLKMSYNTYTL